MLDNTDEFANAFADFAESESKETKKNVVASVPEHSDTTTPEQPDTMAVEHSSSPDTVAEPVEDAASQHPPGSELTAVSEPTGDAQPEPAVLAPEKTYVDNEALERLADLISQRSAPPSQVEQLAVPQQEEPIFTQEEQGIISAYEKEWPDVRRAEAIVRKGEYKQLVGYIFNQIQPYLRSLETSVATLSHDTHLRGLREAVSDYDTISREDISAWADKQPPYLQTAFNNVIKNGTVDEVKDLIERFKQETGVKVTSPTPAKQATELPPAAKKAAAALAPVSSKRSAVIQGTDPSDFDGAFESFAGKSM